MTINMDSSINRASDSVLTVATLIVTALAAKIRSAAKVEIPEGYEDATGFHIGDPRFSE